MKKSPGKSHRELQCSASKTGSTMNLDELHEIAAKRRDQQAQFQNRIVVCTGTACHAAQSDQVLGSLEAEVKQRGLAKQCAITGGGCRGLCAAGPMVTVEPQHVLYKGCLLYTSDAADEEDGV